MVFLNKLLPAVHRMKTCVQGLQRQVALKIESRLRRHDGVFRHMRDIAEPRKDANAKICDYIGCTIDISEQKVNESAVVEFNRKIERQSREMHALCDMKADLQVCVNLAEFKPVLSKCGRQLFPDGTVAICLFNNSRNLVEAFVSWGATEFVTEMFAPNPCWSLRKKQAAL